MGPTAVVVIFGSLFGQVLVQTGIASTIIRKTVELGGDRPLITTILLSIVVSIIFTSTFGAGAVVAIGVIVLPILLSLGVSKAIALSSYVMSVGAGMYVNVVLFQEIQGMFNGLSYDSNYLKFAFPAMAIQLLIIIAMLFVKIGGKNNRTTNAWAAPSSNPSQQSAPWYSLFTPIIPVLLIIAFNWPTIPAFLIGSFYALFVCGRIKSYQDSVDIVTRTFYDGVVDIAPMLGFLFVLPMFNRIADVNSDFFTAVLGDIIPTSPLILAIAFAILAPMGLFRGPLTIFGAGAATFGILLGLGTFSPIFVFALMYIPTITMNISCCPTQSWNLWAINYTKATSKEFMKTGLAWGWLICILNSLLAYFIYI